MSAPRRGPDGMPVLVECLAVVVSLCLLGIGYAIGLIWFRILGACAARAPGRVPSAPKGQP